MAPKYKLIYFNIKGLAEPVRFMLSYGNEEFEDYRFSPEDWPSIKPSTPFGKAPVLEVDGKQIHQSVAICRYLAKKYGLAGSNDWEDLEIDAIIDTIIEFRAEQSKYAYEGDEKVKEKLKGPLLETTVPFHMKKFEEIVANNNGYFVGGKLTWVDIYFVGTEEYMSHLVGHSLVEKFPNLKALKGKVTSIPNIKAWLDKRPKTNY